MIPARPAFRLLRHIKIAWNKRWAYSTFKVIPPEYIDGKNSSIFSALIVSNPFGSCNAHNIIGSAFTVLQSLVERCTFVLAHWYSGRQNWQCRCFIVRLRRFIPKPDNFVTRPFFSYWDYSSVDQILVLRRKSRLLWRKDVCLMGLWNRKRPQKQGYVLVLLIRTHLGKAYWLTTEYYPRPGYTINVHRRLVVSRRYFAANATIEAGLCHHSWLCC